MKKAVYGKSGDFTFYSLEIGKNLNENISFEKGMGMWNISRQFLFEILKDLCIPVLVVTVCQLYALSTYYIHFYFAFCFC